VVASDSVIGILVGLVTLSSIKVRSGYLRAGCILASAAPAVAIAGLGWREGTSDIMHMGVATALGVILGSAAALLVGFVERQPPQAVHDALSNVAECRRRTTQIQHGGVAGASPELFLLAGEALCVAASTVKTSMGPFSQGPATRAWNELQAHEHALTVGALRFLSVVEGKVGNAESPEARVLFAARSDQVHRILTLMRDGMTALADRIAHYQTLTALLLATMALLVSIAGLALQAMTLGN